MDAMNVHVYGYPNLHDTCNAHHTGTSLTHVDYPHVGNQYIYIVNICCIECRKSQRVYILYTFYGYYTRP